MYSVLIVDDEKLIRDDVYGLLAMEDDLELDLSAAASAVEALDIMELRKIDIAVIDINMPQMSGLELYDVIREKWPYCKVIFLTGYSDFDYIYKVHKHAKYVLKAEEDENILIALRESIEELENSLLLEQLTDWQPRQLQSSVAYERNQFLVQMFNGYYGPSQLTAELAARLDIALDLEKPLYYVLLRHETWYSESYQEQQNFRQLFYQLVNRHFFDFMKGTFFEYSVHDVVLLLQPKKLLKEESVIRMLTAAGELFQRAVKKNLSWNVSLLIGARAVSLERMLREFKEICDQAVWLKEEEVARKEIGTADTGGDSLTESRKQELMQKVLKLEYCLDGMEEENTLALLRELQGDMQRIKSMHDLFALEMYCTISARLIGWIKRLGLQEEIALKVGTMNLYNVSFHENWQDAFGYLRYVTESIFTLRNQSAEKQTEDAVRQVKNYIAEHLGGDTSLHRLAEQVHFSQEYLLRIFKKREGVTILQYINELKLSAAKQLLAETELSVSKIAQQLGFASQGYFGRFFRQKTGLAPNAYRDAEHRKV